MVSVELTLEQLRSAILRLPDDQRRKFLDEIERASTRVAARDASGSPQSILDIPAVSVGTVLRPFNSDDDLLGEMLEERV
jgi:hypothetical protein